MDTDNMESKPDTEEKRYVTDIDGNRVEQVALPSTGIVDFGYKLIEALYGGCLKDGTPEEKKQELIDEIAAVCLIRGLHEFQTEMSEAKGDLVGVLSTYGKGSMAYIQDCSNQLHDVEKDPEREMKPGDVKLLAFLKSKGVVHMSKTPTIDKDGVLDGLRQMAKSMGLSDAAFDQLIAGETPLSDRDREDADSQCDCPGCKLRRGLDKMVPESMGNDEGEFEPTEEELHDSYSDDGSEV